MDGKKRFSSLSQLSSMLSISEQTLGDWMENGVIPRNTYIKIGEILRFDEDLILQALVEHNEEKNTDFPPGESIQKMPSVVDYSRVCEMAIAFAELSDKCLEQMEDLFEYLNDFDFVEEPTKIESAFGGLLFPESVLAELKSIRDWMEDEVPQDLVDDMSRLIKSFEARYLKDSAVNCLNQFAQIIDWHHGEGYANDFEPFFADRVQFILEYLNDQRLIVDESSKSQDLIQPPIRGGEIVHCRWSKDIWHSNGQ
jgi:hypothetical protein